MLPSITSCPRWSGVGRSISRRASKYNASTAPHAANYAIWCHFILHKQKSQFGGALVLVLAMQIFLNSAYMRFDLCALISAYPHETAYCVRFMQIRIWGLYKMWTHYADCDMRIHKRITAWNRIYVESAWPALSSNLFCSRTQNLVSEMSDDWNKTTNGSNVQSNAIAPILVLCLRDLLLLVLVRFSWYVGGVRFTRGWKEDIPPAYMVALCPPPSPVHSILAQHIGSYGRRVHG